MGHQYSPSLCGRGTFLPCGAGLPSYKKYNTVTRRDLKRGIRGVGCSHHVIACATLQTNSTSKEGLAKRVLICGGGIMGVSTAYYLVQKGIIPTLIERNEIAGAASGKAGGFLALDWNDDTPIGPLARLSFSLHEDLAQKLGDDCGYRRCDTLGVEASQNGRVIQHQDRNVPQWVNGRVSRIQVIGSTENTAQVHPYKLTHALLKEAKKGGLQVKHGAVEGIAFGDGASKRVTGAIVDGNIIEAEAVVIAMGPWSRNARKWLPLPLVSAEKYHSILLKPQEELSAHAIFTTIRTLDGRRVAPEVYPRPDGEVYICGEGDSQVLPDDPCDVKVMQKQCDNLKSFGATVSSTLEEAPVTKQQACYLPISLDGLPMIGSVPGVEGAFVAAGHSCWGILNGPGTGLLMAEVIAGESTSLDISAFDPARFL